ncbi:MAG: hypothetical protein GC179_13140 [Anaerolineaceae bacterium]|nr:hypothetical protein [Anaerolineaceae bacterium]
MGYDIVEAAARRQRNIRIVLFVIILMTTPFYCIGFLLWGTSQPRGVLATPTVALTNTPIGGDITATVGQPTITPFGLTPSLLSPLQPTPLQFVPINRPPTQFVPPTATPYLVPIIPSDTLAPTLTLIPSATPYPTDTPQPSFTPPPTFTPTNTDQPVVVPPTDTPLPFDDTTPEAPPP